MNLLATLLLPLTLLGGPFHDLPFDAALKRAAQEKKLVMVDFYTTWCGPCKLLDRTTWKDAAVLKWLGEKTVALKIDAEKRVELAKEYDVRVYPTIVFIEPDRSERARVIGYKPPDKFLFEAKNVIAGVTLAERLIEKVATNPRNPSSRQELADELTRLGRHAEALEHYLVCFDEGVEQDPAYSGVRVSFLLGSIARLATEYAPARDALAERRERAAVSLREGRGDPQDAADVGAIDRTLQQAERSLELYDELAALGVDRTVRGQLFDLIIDLLLKAERYEDVVEGVGDASIRMKARIDAYRDVSEKFGEGPESPAAYLKTQMIRDGGKYYLALLGTDRLDQAGSLAAMLVEFDPSSNTFRALIKKANEAGKPDLADELLARAKQILPEERHGLLERTARRRK